MVCGHCLLILVVCVHCLHGQSVPINKVVSLGDVVNLECPLNTSHVVAVEWKHDGKQILLHDLKGDLEQTVGDYTSKNDWISTWLEFQINTSAYLGNYLCLKYSTTGLLVKSVWNLFIQDEDSGSLNLFLGTPFVERDNRLITCITEGSTESTVSLEKKSRNGNWETLTIAPSVVSEGYNATNKWTFDLTEAPSGFYRCTAFNLVGSLESSQIVYLSPWSTTTRPIMVISCICVAVASIISVTLLLRGKVKFSSLRKSTVQTRACKRRSNVHARSAKYETMLSMKPQPETVLAQRADGNGQNDTYYKQERSSTRKLTSEICTSGNESEIDYYDLVMITDNPCP